MSHMNTEQNIPVGSIKKARTFMTLLDHFQVPITLNSDIINTYTEYTITSHPYSSSLAKLNPITRKKRYSEAANKTKQ